MRNSVSKKDFLAISRIAIDPEPAEIGSRETGSNLVIPRQWDALGVLPKLRAAFAAHPARYRRKVVQSSGCLVLSWEHIGRFSACFRFSCLNSLATSPEFSAAA